MQVFTDAACRGNPGPAAIAFLILKEDVNLQEVHPIGPSTNNRAEYLAIIAAIRRVKGLGSPGTIELYSDSQLVINQVNGTYAVKSLELKAYYFILMELIKDLNITFTHVPRTNKYIAQCDALCNRILDRNPGGKW